jgi:hypothetical protein
MSSNTSFVQEAANTLVQLRNTSSVSSTGQPDSIVKYVIRATLQLRNKDPNAVVDDNLINTFYNNLHTRLEEALARHARRDEKMLKLVYVRFFATPVNKQVIDHHSFQLVLLLEEELDYLRTNQMHEIKFDKKSSEVMRFQVEVEGVIMDPLLALPVACALNIPATLPMYLGLILEKRNHRS